jgi:hypothetical protein
MAVAKKYRPIIKSRRGDYRGSAMVGTHSAVIGWDVAADKIPDDLMGFSIQRTAYNAGTGKVLKKKKNRGIDVRIVYHAKSGDKATHENEGVLREVRLKSVATARTNTGNILLRSQNIQQSHFLNDKPSWADVYYRRSRRSRKFRDRVVFAGGL